MPLVDYFPHISYFLKEESGAPFIEHILIAALVTTIFALFYLALKKDN
jgi:Flp pilus assembly pilin Flp